MAGFNGTTMFADNVDFSGSNQPSPQVLTDGQLLIGSTATPNIKVGTLTAGAGISITNGSGSITINSIGGGITWTTTSINIANMANNTGYFCLTGGGAITLGLPQFSVVGDTVRVSLEGAASWQITQGAGQQIRVGNNLSTSGAGGSITSTALGDSVELVCAISNTLWIVQSSQGNFTIV